jgi:hypothetical protein
MPNNEFPILDGIAPSWADIIVRATPKGGPLIEMKDIAAINTGTSLEVGEQEGASGGRVIKRTSGRGKQEASITFYRSGFQRFLRALMALAPSRGNQRLISLVHFGIQIQHTPPGDVEIYEYRIKGCRYMGRTMNAAEGVDAQQVECPISVLEIADMIDGEEVVMI